MSKPGHRLHHFRVVLWSFVYIGEITLMLSDFNPENGDHKVADFIVKPGRIDSPEEMEEGGKKYIVTNKKTYTYHKPNFHIRIASMTHGSVNIHIRAPEKVLVTNSRRKYPTPRRQSKRC